MTLGLKYTLDFNIFHIKLDLFKMGEGSALAAGCGTILSYCLFTILGIAHTVIHIVAVIASSDEDGVAMVADRAKGRTYYSAFKNLYGFKIWSFLDIFRIFFVQKVDIFTIVP